MSAIMLDRITWPVGAISVTMVTYIRARLHALHVVPRFILINFVKLQKMWFCFLLTGDKYKITLVMTMTLVK